MPEVVARQLRMGLLPGSDDDIANLSTGQVAALIGSGQLDPSVVIAARHRKRKAASQASGSTKGQVWRIEERGKDHEVDEDNSRGASGAGGIQVKSEKQGASSSSTSRPADIRVPEAESADGEDPVLRISVPQHELGWLCLKGWSWSEDTTKDAAAENGQTQGQSQEEERCLYCLACSRWATFEHRKSKKHLKRVAHANTQPAGGPKVLEALAAQAQRRGGSGK